MVQTPSTTSTPSDDESFVLIRRTEATGKWRSLICAEFEGAPSLYLTAEDWVDCGLKVGMRISVKQYADLERRSKVARALREALKLFEVRPRLEGELSRALLRKGWEREVIEGAMARLREKGLLNDEKLVRDLVDVWGGTRSRREIRAKLRSRGAPTALVTQALESCVDDEREREAALRLAEKSFRRAAGRLADVDERRILMRLVRKGFSPSLARWAVREAIRRLGEQEVDPRA
ncbi:regulatory protein RecX [Alicyclobacillus acidocaldarius]|uniref:Regulatory protein RecX n=1 Tax=Alicyclobacillus acidocaldarius (strain Tc-4-1) TaxID=1048834 RepID=F8IIL8_ALIAT|nr:regulatory protein RecX [Alicyclobacillus acidocaldarius]AEJ43350.1 regulatory protein RecX [Alicyclobacillus acidocaldarius subsp. acidocaldarius Tc-4-1]